MTTLCLETYTMPAASLGPDNPLPSLGGCLPYRVQNRYDRVRKDRAFQVVRLENETLRAIFLMELGGRLWSLVHKPTGRELLYRNPVFQPGALACCNAWFSGGIEWNCCTGGHTPLTCSPLFAARVRGDDGEPVLRIYEFERVLQIPYQIDFSLPAGSPWLYARMRVRNPPDRELPLYWWSNIAVPESPDLRVLAPADAALKYNYKAKELARLPMPCDDGVRDASYPCNLPSSADYFFDIPLGQRPWEAALDKDGRGLVYASSSALRGRKLFVWGMGAGGRHWQEFLSVPGKPYIEIQGGLAQTQGQKVPLAARSEVAWVEAYGLMEADPKVVHGKDWQAARADVEARLDRSLPAADIERRLVATAAQADRAPEEVLFRGSGWGALENERRRLANEEPMCSGALVFDEASLGADQRPWLALLKTGQFPQTDEPVSWMCQDHWQKLLEESREKHWLTWLHLGVMHYQAGRKEQAVEAWQRSLTLHPSPWAMRNLGAAALREKQMVEGAQWLLKARRMLPALAPLAAECYRALLDADMCAEALALLDEMPAEVGRNGRIRVLAARAALKLGDLERAEAILLDKDLLVPDIFEGELMLSDTWYGLQEQKLARREGLAIDEALRQRVQKEFPPPKNLDFRMAAAR
ncbi:MAG: DUF5107 domain-containing protein [Planctomycetota bacterium]|nr:DUF5107 domain-containing protein [Planctomycetota bacterium]